MKRILGALFAIALAAWAPPASADSFTVFGSIQDGFAGPAEGATLTLCEYGVANGFTATLVVPDSGLVAVVVPHLPGAVALEIEGDPVYEDVHVLVAQPICPVSPCNPNQVASFEIHLARRPEAPGLDRRHPLPAPLRMIRPVVDPPGRTVLAALARDSA